MNIAAKVREFIAKNYYLAGAASLDDEASLLDHGVIDSTGVLEVVSFLEEAFGVQVQDDELVPDNLDSIGKISRFVARKVCQ